MGPGFGIKQLTQRFLPRATSGRIMPNHDYNSDNSTKSSRLPNIGKSLIYDPKRTQKEAQKISDTIKNLPENLEHPLAIAQQKRPLISSEKNILTFDPNRTEDIKNAQRPIQTSLFDDWIKSKMPPKDVISFIINLYNDIMKSSDQFKLNKTQKDHIEKIFMASLGAFPSYFYTEKLTEKQLMHNNTHSPFHPFWKLPREGQNVNFWRYSTITPTNPLFHGARGQLTRSSMIAPNADTFSDKSKEQIEKDMGHDIPKAFILATIGGFLYSYVNIVEKTKTPNMFGQAFLFNFLRILMAYGPATSEEINNLFPENTDPAIKAFTLTALSSALTKFPKDMLYYTNIGKTGTEIYNQYNISKFLFGMSYHFMESFCAALPMNLYSTYQNQKEEEK